MKKKQILIKFYNILIKRIHTNKEDNSQLNVHTDDRPPVGYP